MRGAGVCIYIAKHTELQIPPKPFFFTSDSATNLLSMIPSRTGPPIRHTAVQIRISYHLSNFNPKVKAKEETIPNIIQITICHLSVISLLALFFEPPVEFYECSS